MKCIRTQDSREVATQLLTLVDAANAVSNDKSCTCNHCHARRMYNFAVETLGIAYGLALSGEDKVLTDLYNLLYDYRKNNQDI